MKTAFGLKSAQVALFLFAQQSWQTRLLAREQSRPDSGEDNPNDKGATGQR